MGTRAYFWQNTNYTAQDLRAMLEGVVLSDGVTTGLEVTYSAPSTLYVSPGKGFITISAAATGQRYMVNVTSQQAATNVSGGSAIWTPQTGNFRKDRVFISLDDDQLGGADEVKVQFALGTPGESTLPSLPSSTDNLELAQVYSSDSGVTVTDVRTPVILAGADPVGSIQLTAATGAPFGWLKCDGSEVSRSTYADLYAAIGTTYGSGDGASTFRVPDLRGRVPLGVMSGAYSVAATGGTTTETLDLTKIPSHGHGMTHGHSGSTADDGASAQHYHNAGGEFWVYSPGNIYTGVILGAGTTGKSTSPLTLPGGGGHWHTVTVGASTKSVSDDAGGGQAHNNMQPYMALHYIIKAG